MGLFPIPDVAADFYDTSITLAARLPDTRGLTGGRQVNYSDPITMDAQVDPAREPFVWTVVLNSDPGPEYQVGAAMESDMTGRVGVTDRKDYTPSYIIMRVEKQKATF